MDANFTLLPDAVSASGASTKEAILKAAAERFADAYGVDGADALEAMQEREALGSTGFGHGAAIPHARIDGLKSPVAVFLKLDNSVDFGSADGMNVTRIFGLLSPLTSGAGHLHALAAISRMMREEETQDAIDAAHDSETIYAVLSNMAERDAA